MPNVTITIEFDDDVTDLVRSLIALWPSLVSQPKRGRPPKRVPISPSRRIAIFARDGYHCIYCGRGVEDGISLQVDHVIAIANGGDDSDENLVTSCNECNLGKGSAIIGAPRLGEARELPVARSKVDECTEWLCKILADGKWFSSRELLREAELAGYTESVMQKAKRRVAECKHQGKRWYVRLLDPHLGGENDDNEEMAA